MSKSTKKRILDNAFQLFVESSYESVTMEEIAAESNVSKGAVFHYFDSKHELAKESLIKGFQEIWTPLYSELEKLEKPEEKLKSIIDFSVDFFTKRPKVTKLLVEIYEKDYLSEKEELKDDELIEFYEDFIEHIANIYREFGVSNPREKSNILMAALDGLALQFFLMEDRPNFPKVTKLKKELYGRFIYGSLQKEDHI